MLPDPVPARFTAALEKATALQREIFENHRMLATGLDAAAEERLTALLLQRGLVFEAVARSAVEWVLTGGSFELIAAAPSLPAPVAESPPVPTRVVVEEPPKPEIAPEAVAAIVGQKLAPAWTRQQPPAVEKPLDTEMLTAMLDWMGEAPPLLSGEDLRHETEHIENVTSELGVWRRFPRDIQVKLLEIMTGRLRAAQDVAERSVEKNLLYNLDGCFRRLRQYAKDAKPGVAYGLARDHHVPQNDWRTWSNARHAELVKECLPEGEETERPRAPRRRSEPEEEKGDEKLAEKPVSEDWPHWSFTRGVDAVMVGGEIREDRRDALERAFQFGSLEWVPGSQPRRCEALAERIAHGRVGLILLLRGFISHKDSDKIVRACDAAKVRFVLVDSGYGVTQVRLALERAFEPRRGAA